ncbi:hypothetical protein DFH07DRAFT_837059 [Mycena maculata]|uniref:Uncharacterized protein n=1 Tax=Mycena maculata TaxID=230809 RepID=A0AAD7N181_9AGAR|nr:hypothetical protein DFH07DRAFT_837059 [Mycena maculata]
MATPTPMTSSSAVQLAKDANIPIQSSTPDIRKGSSSGIQLARDADFLIQSFLPGEEPRSPLETPKLPLPYCVPQLMPVFDAPFARGYNSALESVNIPQEQLLAFIDGLNLAMTASPPLRVVNLAGMVIGFVPYHWAQITSAAIQTGAQVGMRVLSKTLTDRYLRAANLRLFKPRGLSVRICTAAAMQHLVMHTPITEGPSKLTRFGRGVGSLLLRIPLPITSVLVHAVADAPPKVPAMGPDSYRSKKLLATQRRVAALEGYALPLDFDVPKPVKAQGVMDTMASWGVKFDSWKDGRRQTKAEKGRLQLAQIESGAVSPPQARGILGGGLLGRGIELLGRGPGGNDSGQGGRRVPIPGGLIGLVHTGVGSVLNRGGGGGVLGRRISRRGNDQLELQVKDADLLEYWASAKVLWVVIMSSELDEEIEGIELAESQEDEETVDERTWQTEMNVELEELELDEEVERVAAMQEEKTTAQKQ